MVDINNFKPKNQEDELVMRFDPNTIEHLGVQMYTTLPPVIAEIIANSYDADAETVTIFLNDINEKEIIIQDDGHGMDYGEINSKFLLIGRNRREDDQGNHSPIKKRLVIGRKGIGKLSFFGIASQITVDTIRDEMCNAFRLDLKELRASKGEYKPKIITVCEKTKKANGTKVILSQLSRKSPFNPADIARALARSFTIFDEEDFCVQIVHNKVDTLDIKNDLKYEGIPVRFQWDFPLEISEIADNAENEEMQTGVKYAHASEIKGRIISSDEQTIPAYMRGIALFSRGKLVNDYSFFDVNATSHGYSYLTGGLDISFIDEWGKDVISTNRRSLNWEDEDTVELKNYLNKVIRYVYNKQRKLREESKIKAIQKLTGLDVNTWIEELPTLERKLARKMINAIIKSEGLDVQKAGEMVTYVKDSFQFQSFKEFAAELDEIANIPAENLLQLLHDWQLIEAREFYKLSMVRIETIKQFEEYIKQNVKEVPIMHNFLKTFPWLLDPRIMEFEDEVYYSNLLQEKYPDNDEELDSNRRIDFLCTSLAQNFFVIELKKPHHRLREKDILQANDYRTFVQSLQGNEPASSKTIVAYIICGDSNLTDRKVAGLADPLKAKGYIYIKTYSELLTNATKYHKEFIERYDQLQKRGGYSL